jgi:alpha-galactosidase
MKDLAAEKDISGTVALYDIDKDAAAANETIGNNLMARHNPGQWKFNAVQNLGDALRGSDFVFVSILPLDFAEMDVDVHLPERHGIYQSVGDTVGPGGIIRALRTIPMYQEIARAIRDHAPDAWVFNYTNPMTICTRTLYREFPGIKAFGCCHEVFGTQKLLVRAIEDAGLAPRGSVRREEIRTNVVGINHFTWIDKASWKGLDLFPVWDAFVEKYAESGFDAGGDDNWLNNYFTSMDRVKMDLYRRFGIIAAAGDRHLAEFCPPSWYLSSPEKVKEWKFTLTPVSFRIKMRDELLRKSRDFRSGKETMTTSESGEEGIALMKALLGMGDMVSNVNLPNAGQMPLFPNGAVVETNAVFSRDGVRPVMTAGLGSALRSLTLVHVGIQEGIVEAAFERDLEKAFLVFLNDPQIHKLGLDDARALFDEMVEKTVPKEFGYR